LTTAFGKERRLVEGGEGIQVNVLGEKMSGQGKPKRNILEQMIHPGKKQHSLTGDREEGEEEKRRQTWGKRGGTRGSRFSKSSK